MGLDSGTGLEEWIAPGAVAFALMFALAFLADHRKEYYHGQIDGWNTKVLSAPLLQRSLGDKSLTFELEMYDSQKGLGHRSYVDTNGDLVGDCLFDYYPSHEEYKRDYYHLYTGEVYDKVAKKDFKSFFDSLPEKVKEKIKSDLSK